MPKVGARSEVERYRRLGDNIIATGIKAMEACAQCVKAKETCFVKRGYKKCGRCTKKGMTCSGNFSQANFEKMEVQKKELQHQVRQGRKLMKLFSRQLLMQQDQVSRLEQRLEQLNRRQDALLDHEARALGVMDELAGSSELAEFSFHNPLFLQDDPDNLDMPAASPSPRDDYQNLDWNSIPIDQQIDWGQLVSASVGNEFPGT